MLRRLGAGAAGSRTLLNDRRKRLRRSRLRLRPTSGGPRRPCAFHHSATGLGLRPGRRKSIHVDANDGTSGLLRKPLRRLVHRKGSQLPHAGSHRHVHDLLVRLKFLVRVPKGVPPLLHDPFTRALLPVLLSDILLDIRDHPCWIAQEGRHKLVVGGHLPTSTLRRCCGGGRRRRCWGSDRRRGLFEPLNFRAEAIKVGGERRLAVERLSTIGEWLPRLLGAFSARASLDDFLLRRCRTGYAGGLLFCRHFFRLLHGAGSGSAGLSKCRNRSLTHTEAPVEPPRGPACRLFPSVSPGVLGRPTALRRTEAPDLSW